MTSIEIIRLKLLARPFTIVPDFDKSRFRSYNHLLQNFHYLLQPESSPRSKVLQQLLGFTKGKQEYHDIEVPKEIFKSPALPNFVPNDKQLIAASAVHRADLFPLVSIQAPFGTGKTALSAMLIRSLVLSSPGHSILLVSTTNRAADNIAMLLSSMAIQENQPVLQPLRLYAQAKENSNKTNQCDHIAVHKLALQTDDAPQDIKIAARQLQDYKQSLDQFYFDANWSPEKQQTTELDIAWKTTKINELSAQLEQWAIKTHFMSIIVTTCSTALDSRLSKMTFTHGIIDESAAASVIDTIAVASKLDVERAMQLILVGDRHQLAPYSLGLGFAGELTAISPPTMIQDREIVADFPLDQCYRLHPDLLAFPNENFYENSIIPAVTREDRSLVSSCFPFPRKDVPIVFCSIDSTDTIAMGTSRMNLSEVHASICFFRFLLKYCQLPLDSIAILTFYEAQRFALCSALGASLGSDAAGRVFNIDSQQGREIDGCAIISCVRAASSSIKEQGIGFLAEYRRLNVALTRAKHGLILCGQAETLSGDPLWEALLRHYGDWNLVQPGFHTLLDSYEKIPRNQWYDTDGWLKGLGNGQFNDN